MIQYSDACALFNFWCLMFIANRNLMHCLMTEHVFQRLLGIIHSNGLQGHAIVTREQGN